VEAVYLEAIRLQALDRNTEAFELFRHAEAMDSTSAEVKYALSSFYLALKDDSTGIRYLQEAAALSPDNYWYAEQLVETLFDRQRYEAAAGIAEQMRTRFPKQEMPLAFLLEIYPHIGEYDKAVRLLEQLEKEQGKSEEISMRKVSIWMRQGKEKKAFKELNDLIKTYSAEPGYKLLLADAYMEQEQYANARKIYTALLKTNPHDAQAALGVARCQLLTGDTLTFRSSINTVLQDEALDEDTRNRILYMFVADKSLFDTTYVCQKYDEAIAAGLDDPRLLQYYAGYLTENHLANRLTTVLEQILLINPDNEAVRRQLLIEALRQEDLPRIERLCLPVTGRLPETEGDLLYYYYLMAAYSQQDRYEEALATANNALNNLPPEKLMSSLLSDFYALSGDLNHRLGHESEAFANYDSSLVYNPLNVGALNNYAYYLSLQEGSDLNKAEQMSRKTIEIEAENDTYLDTYAWVLFKLHRYEEARTYIDKCLEHATEPNADLYDHAGDIYKALGHNEEAVAFWKKALEVGIENPETVKAKLQ
jgi:tetratricopeptide (TPR) repeat protein